MKVEIQGLWGLLYFVNRLSISKMMVARDSKVAINWINDCSNLNLLYLSSWKEHIRCLKEKFEDIKSMHVQREYNTVADKLSKKVLDNPLGWFFYEETIKENVVNADKFFIF
jgi:hypothetical protein